MSARPETAEARVSVARAYDRRADIALQHGHVAAAERLAWQAVALREGGA